MTITRSASSQSAVRTCSWCSVGSESTVCSVTTSGCASSAREREGVLPVTTAEDAVLVLEQHDVDVVPGQCARRADVVSARALRDGLEDLRPLRARRIVDDDERADSPPRRGRRAAPFGRRTQRCRSRTRAAGTSRRSRSARSACAPFRQILRAIPDVPLPKRGSIGWRATLAGSLGWPA